MRIQSMLTFKKLKKAGVGALMALSIVLTGTAINISNAIGATMPEPAKTANTTITVTKTNNTVISPASNAAAAVANPKSGSSAVFNAQQTAEIERIIHSYLVKNPQVFVEVVHILQNKANNEMEQRIQAIKTAAASHKHEIFNAQSAGSAVIGSTSPKILMAEFYSYQCPICRDVEPILDRLVKTNPDLQVIFVPWPFKGNEDVYAAKMALAAKKQGKFYDVHETLMHAQDALTQESVDKAVSKLGLNMAKLHTDFNDKGIDAALRASFKLAHDLNLIGTPMIFITNAQFTKFSLIPGRADEASIQQAINEVH